MDNSNTATQPEAEAVWYVSEKLGIKFQYPQGFEDKAAEQGNKIMYLDWSPEMYIAVFQKNEDETIENAIIGLIQKEDVNTADCKVVNRNTKASGNQVYTIDLADPISYTDEEQEEIRLADENWTPDAGPEDGEWTKKSIYNKRLVEKCSTYAEPLGLGTSTSIPSIFLYNEALSKTKFVYLPATADPYFHENGTIEFLKQ